MSADPAIIPDEPAIRSNGPDLRARLAVAIGAAFVFSFFSLPATAGAALGVAAGMLLLRRPPARDFFRIVGGANLFTLFMAATLPLTLPGDVAFALGPLRWSRGGLELALLIALKGNAVLLAFMALVGGADLPRLGGALEGLRVPAKLVFVFLFAGRYLYVAGEEWGRLRTAAKLRGFAPRNHPHTYRTYAQMLALTFLNGIDRSRRVYEAMLLRGFAGRFRTTRAAAESRLGVRDRIFLTVGALVLAGLLAADRF